MDTTLSHLALLKTLAGEWSYNVQDSHALVAKKQTERAS